MPPPKPTRFKPKRPLKHLPLDSAQLVFFLTLFIIMAVVAYVIALTISDYELKQLTLAPWIQLV